MAGRFRGDLNADDCEPMLLPLLLCSCRVVSHSTLFSKSASDKVFCVVSGACRAAVRDESDWVAVGDRSGDVTDAALPAEGDDVIAGLGDVSDSDCTVVTPCCDVTADDDCGKAPATSRGCLTDVCFIHCSLPANGPPVPPRLAPR